MVDHDHVDLHVATACNVPSFGGAFVESEGSRIPPFLLPGAYDRSVPIFAIGAGTHAPDVAVVSVAPTGVTATVRLSLDSGAARAFILDRISRGDSVRVLVNL